jgi:putative PIN family toxin of toxin-antitoxin system
VNVFLDTNVLVSAVISRGLCRDLFRTVLEEHDAVFSRLVLDEFVRVLRDKFGAPQPSLEKALILMDDVEVTTNPNVALEAGALETNDATILAAAIEAQADVFVTGDKMLLGAAEKISLPVMSPRTFMELLRVPTDSYPGPPDENGGPRVSEDTAGITRQKAFDFALSIVALCEILDENRQYVFARQLLRAGTSIGANIEEASAAESRSDFAHKMAIASKEARETNYWLRLLDQSGIAQKIDFKPHLEKSLELIRLLTATVKTTKRSTR